MARLSADRRSEALRAVARRLTEREAEILAANARDLEAARPALDSGAMSRALFDRLRLDADKLAGLASGVEQLASFADPLGVVGLGTELDDGLRLYRVTCPIGVIGVIFESRPDALVQIATLCLKSGNAALLKGGREALHSNRILFDVVRSAAVDAGLPQDALALFMDRADVDALLEADGLVDLIVPRGSNALVRSIQERTSIPVLGHADGLCHIYVDARADLEKALSIVVDAKTTYPSACNSVETLLVHEAVAEAFLPRVVASCQDRGVEVRCDERSRTYVGDRQVVEAADSDWRTEYCDLILSVCLVNSVDEAIDFINDHGSAHTDAIVTDDDETWDCFFAGVDSAGVYRNASTRFADGYRYGFGAEVGISTGKLHPRGPVGLEGLVTYKYKLVGDGHVTADYSGPRARRFSHRNLLEEGVREC
jgi:glutamate-5-semialdehyde dehydrogenase